MVFGPKVNSSQQPAECQAAVDAVKELLDTHFDEAEDSADDGKFSLGFRVTFDRSHSPTTLKVTCRVSKVTTDEIECSIDDPNQAKLPL